MPASICALKQWRSVLCRPETCLTSRKSEAAPLPTPPRRERVIMEAMEQLVLRNQRGDFIASGLPNVTALKDLMGFGIPPQRARYRLD